MRKPRPPRAVNVVRAVALLDAGFNWREVGILLADEAGRRTPFAAESVRAAVRAVDREG